MDLSFERVAISYDHVWTFSDFVKTSSVKKFVCSVDSGKAILPKAMGISL